MILNPNSGVDAKGFQQEWLDITRQAQGAGIDVIGYVMTNMARRPAPEIEKEIDLYFSWYGVDGIYLDNTPHEAEHIPYFRGLADYTREVRPGAIVAMNPGWTPDERYMEFIDILETYEYDYADMVRWHHCMPGPGAFFRRELVERIGGRDPSFRYANDFDFWLRAGLVGPFARVPETLATFRFHPGARSSSDLGREMAEEHIRMTDRVFANPELPAEVRKVEREAYSSAYYITGTQLGGTLWSSAKRRYFLRALRLAPRKYLTEYRERWVVIGPALLGPLYPPLRPPLKAVYHWLRAARKQPGAGKVPRQPRGTDD
jgi:hypothetical protein